MFRMNIKSLIEKRPAISYFILTFLISWTGAFSLVASKLIHREPIPTFYGILMFPLLLLGPFLSGIILTLITGGIKGIRSLLSKLNPGKIPEPWYLVLFIPPAFILFVLFLLSIVVSKEYHPNVFPIGFLFGILAGFMEETGWMGFAFPNMSKKRSPFANSIILGLIWSIWHLPAINFLGTAIPHGAWWFSYFLSFAMVMTAMRVIIVWIYRKTESLLLCQLMHISSTGFLVTLSPSPMSIQHEPAWYFAYSILLWAIVILIAPAVDKPPAPGNTKFESS
jgi:membrane protease YdiL (CAAX protease family)